jgi:hypothetical protein
MNSNVMPSIIQIDEEKLKQLTTQVRETLATGINHQPSVKKQNKFGIVDLWNCRNKMRTANSRK